MPLNLAPARIAGHSTTSRGRSSNYMLRNWAVRMPSRNSFSSVRNGTSGEVLGATVISPTHGINTRVDFSFSKYLNGRYSIRLNLNENESELPEHLHSEVQSVISSILHRYPNSTFLSNLEFEAYSRIIPAVEVPLAPVEFNVSELNWAEDFSAFNSVYQKVKNDEYSIIEIESTVAAGGYDLIGVPAGEMRTFGLEIEVDFPESSDWGYEKRELAYWMYNNGLSYTNVPRRWHHAARFVHPDGTAGYTRDPAAWTVEFDRSVDGVEGQRGCEVVSPILTNTPETWRNVALIINKIIELGGRMTPLNGLHVNIGAAGSTPQSVNRLLEVSHKFDSILTRLGHNSDIGPRHRGRSYCMTSVPVNASLNSVVVNNGHNSAINLTHIYDRDTGVLTPSGRYEFRIFDGTLDVWRIKHHVSLCMAQVAASLSDRELPTQPQTTPTPRTFSNGRRERLTGEAWKENTLPFRIIMDYLSFPEHLREVSTYIFANSRWS